MALVSLGIVRCMLVVFNNCCLFFVFNLFADCWRQEFSFKWATAQGPRGRKSPSGIHGQSPFRGLKQFADIVYRLLTLKALRYQGLSLELLRFDVFHAIIVNEIMYGISAWYGFLNKSHLSQINSLSKRAFKYGYVNLLQDYDNIIYSLKQHIETTPFVICFPVPSLLVLTYELSVMVKSELHKRHLLIQ